MYGDSCPLKIYFHGNFLDSPHYHPNGQNIPNVFNVLRNTEYVYGIVRNQKDAVSHAKRTKEPVLNPILPSYLAASTHSSTTVRTWIIIQ